MPKMVIDKELIETPVRANLDVLAGLAMESEDAHAVEMPSPHAFLSEPQRECSALQAVDIYTEVWDWLVKNGYSSAVSTSLIEQYAMCVARWIQCEQIISSYGFTEVHPNTSRYVPSAYVGISMQYMKQAAKAWEEIANAIKNAEPPATVLTDEGTQNELWGRLIQARETKQCMRISQTRRITSKGENTSQRKSSGTGS